MYARHPKTGALIRVLNSEGSVWKDSKTLVWLEGTESQGTEEPPWSRWDIGASSIGAWTTLTAKGINPDVAILLGPIQQTRRWLLEGTWRKCRIVVAPKALLEDIGLEDLSKLRITNMVCLEECINLYPFLEQPWTGSTESAKALVALILQYSRSFPISANTQYDVVAAKLGLSLKPTLESPPPLIFVTQFYVPNKAKRAKEINLCLSKNAACPYIDRIVLLNEKLYDLPTQSPKITQENVVTRLRFSTVIRWIYEKAPADAIVVIANSDIFLDNTWRILWSINMKDKFLSLLRWDEQDGDAPPKLFGPRADSQDTWVVSAQSVKERTWDWAALDFPFGKGGCDNAFNIEMLRKKFLIVNPCMNLITHHVQMSGIREYDPLDIVDKPMYMHLQPTGIHDLNPDKVLVKPETTKIVPSLALNIRGPLSDSQRATFLKMVKVTGFSEAAVPLYKFQNVFQTYTGLLHTYSSILIGKTKALQEAWGNVELSITSPCLEIETALVAPYPDGMTATQYLLDYIGKIFVLRGLPGAEEGEWQGSDEPEFREALELFSWDQEEIPVVKRNANYKIWCRKAYAWLPCDDRRVTSYEVDALRAALRGWEPASREKRRLVCVVDNSWVTEAFCDRVEQLLDPTVDVSCIYPGTTLSNAAHLLKGAWGVLVLGGKGSVERWGLSWILPKGARVWEMQIESAPSVDLYALCASAGLEHSLTVVARANPMPKDIDNAVEKITGAVLADVLGTGLESESKPRILMPKSTGFFHHAGDSFREMVQLWAEKGYVKVDEVVGLNHVWMGAIGDTLLYDRPTLEWLQASSPSEQKWRRALFGNPTPPQGGLAWSFWPRRPRLVEMLVEQGMGTVTERPRGIVFYGRSENRVQLGRRTGHDWATAFKAPEDEFVHVEGEKPYPFSQRDYLKRLASAKWGLCLAGYGAKCHREVECMAMGCVPVVAEEVDITGYAVPPQEGVHFLRVSEPADIQKVLLAAAPKWSTMSAACRAWYQENVSAEGMWKLTKRLTA